MPLTPEETLRIFEIEKARLEARKKILKTKQKSKLLDWLIIVAFIFFMYIIFTSSH